MAPGGATIPSILCAPVPLELCPVQIKKYEKLDSEEERAARSRHIFDHYIMKELLACSHVSAGPWGEAAGWGGCPQCAHSVLRGSSKPPTGSALGATSQPCGWGFLRGFLPRAALPGRCPFCPR